MSVVSVIGAGTMGNGIAHLFALHRHEVRLVDISLDQLENAVKTINKNLQRQVDKEQITEEEKFEALNRISIHSELKKGLDGVELVIEAATEDIDLKKRIFYEMDNFTPQNCILATNTSSISITELSSATSRPEKVIGMHFFNPVPVMELVEIINGKETSQETTEQIVELSTSLRKTPVVVNDDPGFISNKILMPMINEAIDSLYRKTSGVKEIDTIMQLGMAHPMGPLKLADFIGLDVCLNIMKVLEDGFKDSKYKASPLLVELVEAGNLGVKSKLGFYDWTTDSKNPDVAPMFQ